MGKKIYVIGMGPGDEDMMTAQAEAALMESDCIVGYTVYLELLSEKYRSKKLLSTPMKQERKRCEMCFEEAEKGSVVSMICSGDAGVYGMASLMYEVGAAYPDTELIVIPGITAALSGGAVLGAPLSNDFCLISLSDLLTPWEKIEKRLKAAAEGDFCIAIYNPSSIKRSDYLSKACEIMIKAGKSEDTVCGYVENIGREGTSANLCTLKELKDTQVNMFTTVFVGNTDTIVMDNKMVTKRGYRD